MFVVAFLEVDGSWDDVLLFCWCRFGGLSVCGLFLMIFGEFVLLCFELVWMVFFVDVLGSVGVEEKVVW